jgi:hypothetical protein
MRSKDTRYYNLYKEALQIYTVEDAENDLSGKINMRSQQKINKLEKTDICLKDTKAIVKPNKSSGKN